MNNSALHYPMVTVVMPVYNAEKYVGEAIDSILKQTFTDFELLIFNDGSTDSSRELILSFHDPRIRLIDSSVNTGYVKHLNEGLHQARGNYIARMDADDIADSDRFFLQVQYLNTHSNVAACGSWIEFIGSKKGVLEYPSDHRDIITQMLLFGNAMAHPAVMIRKSIVIDHQLLYDASLQPAEDYDFWHRIASIAWLHNISQVLLKYRWHDQNESVTKKTRQDALVKRIRENIIKDLLTEPSRQITAFILDEVSKEVLTNQDLSGIRVDVKRILNTAKYNNQTIKEILTNRYVACCQASPVSGWNKAIHYLKFPKHSFSLRIFLSLFIND